MRTVITYSPLSLQGIHRNEVLHTSDVGESRALSYGSCLQAFRQIGRNLVMCGTVWHTRCVDCEILCFRLLREHISACMALFGVHDDCEEGMLSHTWADLIPCIEPSCMHGTLKIFAVALL